VIVRDVDGGGFVPAAIEVVAPGVEPARCEGSALLVHGILGSGANWRSFVRRLVATSPAAARLRWVLVDLRHHGESTRHVREERQALARECPEPPLPDTVAACADDCLRLGRALGVDWDVLVGHSFGGKVALDLAGRQGANARQLWLLDSPPGAQPERARDTQDELARVIAALRAVGDPLPPRAEVGRRLEALGLSPGLAQWMTTNVRGDETAGYTWKFDLARCEALIADYLTLDFWPFVEAPPAGLDVRVVYGARSDRFGTAERARLGRLPAAKVAVLPLAGHWLHADDPAGLMAVMAAGL
jgi:pimeloyl-ACP methyl ester carboxylesterase